MKLGVFLPVKQVSIFVISLLGAAERRARIAGELRNLGLRFDFLDAIDGRSQLDEHWELLIDRYGAQNSLGRKMANTEFACALSHRLAYQRIYESGLEGAIVLEDDATIGPLFQRLARGRLLQRTNFVQFDYATAFVWKHGRVLHCLDANIQLQRLAVNSPLATGYYLSRAGAHFMLEKTVPVRLPADWPSDLRPLRPYVTIPRVVHSWAQCEASSYLQTQRSLLRGEAHKESTVDSKELARKKRNPKPFGFSLWRRFFCQRIPKEGF